MCEVCKTDQKCAHPWAQCMASRGEHCAACGHTSWAPRRPPDPTPSTSSTEEPEGAASRGRLIPFGHGRATRSPGIESLQCPLNATRRGDGDGHPRRRRGQV
jgi:hypothetical protein